MPFTTEERGFGTGDGCAGRIGLGARDQVSCGGATPKSLGTAKGGPSESVCARFSVGGPGCADVSWHGQPQWGQAVALSLI